MIDSLVKHILNNKCLRVIIFQHVTGIHQQLGLQAVKSKDLESLYDYIKYGQTDLFIKHFDRLHQLILLLQVKKYRKIKDLDLSIINKSNYIERLYWIFDVVFEKNNHVAMKYLIDRLGSTKPLLDFKSYKPNFTTHCYKFTTEMFYVLRDSNFSTVIPFLQNEMINVVVKLCDSDQLESYLSKLVNPNLSSPTLRHPFQSSFSYLFANNNNKDIINTLIRMIDIFKRYSINVIGDVLIGAVESNHLKIIKWIVENVPNDELVAYCQDHIISNVIETHGKKEVLEMLSISDNPTRADWIGTNAIRQGNLDFVECILKTPLDNSHVIRMLVDTIVYGRLDCFELILSRKYQQEHLQLDDRIIIGDIPPECFSVGLVTRLVGLGFNVQLSDGMLATAIQVNQLDTLIGMDSPQLPLRFENFIKLLGYAIECNSLSSIDILLHHPRFKGLSDSTIIDIHCITLHTIPTIEYLIASSIIKFNWDSSSPVDYVLVAKVIRSVYRPDIIDHIQLVGIFLLANDIEWLFDQKIITPSSISKLLDGDRSSVLANLFNIACQAGHYKALDYLFDNCSTYQIANHLSLTSLAQITDDQQFERFWTKIGAMTETGIVSSTVRIISQIILSPKDIQCNPKRAKFMVDIYGTLYRSSQKNNNNNAVMKPIGCPSILALDHHRFVHYPTLIEVFCNSQKVDWIDNYSIQDRLIIFQKAIGFGYILPIPKFLDNNYNNNANGQSNQKDKCTLM
ncbi:hypothetical protein DFA_09219 [Cavenderia fasciculata]|uniref:Uncharacterized protein n=1 Tax=Cavenderia fasciculata TaxID=261658 RepID=F4Q709_CACFS|nr:uncharacterized protein DFA_09219 [Cavenderia fasciculata]EGG16191.1 hypothetical protein DFA_09219 [Cavenderia fasciculata]|eukprot:XP_004354575.1 hypothetical protein DFA_09219 [Cavenderia fasciculata]